MYTLFITKFQKVFDDKVSKVSRERLQELRDSHTPERSYNFQKPKRMETSLLVGVINIF